jgi:hypothetical protein
MGSRVVSLVTELSCGECMGTGIRIGWLPESSLQSGGHLDATRDIINVIRHRGYCAEEELSVPKCK